MKGNPEVQILPPSQNGAGRAGGARFAGAAPAQPIGDTHGGTRGQPRPCRVPRAGPGRRAGSARSRCRPCGAGTHTPAARPRPEHTRWRGHCICTCSKTPARGNHSEDWCGQQQQWDGAQCVTLLLGWLWGEGSPGCAGPEAALVSPRLSQTSGGHTLRVACAKQLQLLTPEVGQQLQVCWLAWSCPSPAALCLPSGIGKFSTSPCWGAQPKGTKWVPPASLIPHLLPFPAGSCSSFSACGHADSKLLQQPLQLQVIFLLEPQSSSFAMPKDQQGHRKSNMSPSVIKKHWAGREQSK